MPGANPAAKQSKAAELPVETPPDAAYVWHGLPGETDHAYRAFSIYRDLGPGRSY
jgi:hypothetical protein